MKHSFHIFILTLAACVVSFLAVSCDRLGIEADDAPSPERAEELSFDLFDVPSDGVQTRSLLSTYSADSRKTCVTLAAYTGGILYGTGHYTSGLTSMKLSLRKGYTYNVYALVNMGDMTGSFPTSESAVSSIVYNIPSYTGGDDSVDNRGLPTAGFLSLAVSSGTSGTQYIPVKRLIAKVTASLSCDWSGARIRTAKIYNMNRKLQPFGASLTHGASSAASSQDILSFQEIHGTTAGNSTTMSATFYVPENMQGTVPGIVSSSDKRPDGGNTAVSEKQDVLTYLEVYVESTGLYTGDITYRSYLGGNATSSFDIARNTIYEWTVNYHENGLQDDNWKKDNDLTDNRYINLVNPIWVEPGDEVTWSNVLSSNITPLSSLNRVFSGANSTNVIGSNGTSSFTVKSTATAGMSAGLTVTPPANVTSALTKTSEVRVIDKVLSWEGYDQAIYASEGRKVYPVTPVSYPSAKVTAWVDYYGMWNGAREHFIGKGSGSSPEWNYTKKHTVNSSDKITSVLTAGSAPTLDRVVYTVNVSTPPGDYLVTTARTKDGKTGVHDDAYIRVADTRYLRWVDRTGNTSYYTNYSYTEDEIHAYSVWNTYSTKSGNSWYQPNYYSVGDASGSGSILGTYLSSSNIQSYLDYKVSDDGTTWIDIANSNLFQWSSTGPTSGSVFVVLKQDLPTGTYGLKISFPDGYRTITSYLHVMNAESKELVIEPSPANVYVGGTVQLYARLYNVVNGVRTTYVDKTSSATFSIPYDSYYISHQGGGVFTGLHATTGARVDASVTEGGVTYNANTSSTRGIINVLEDVPVSYGTPVVSLTYTPNPVSADGGLSMPTLSVSQDVTYASGQTRTLTSGYTAAYSGSATGFTLNASTGQVSAAANIGNQTVSYGTPSVTLSYTGSPIAYTGGTANATVGYSQTKTTSRAATSSRSIGVTVSVQMNGQNAVASATVTQLGSSSSSSTTTVYDSENGEEVSVSFSGSATGFSVNSTTGLVTASSNEGTTSTSYGDPAVTLTYTPNTFDQNGGVAVPSLSYVQTCTTTRSAKASRSVSVRATVRMNGKNGQSSQVTVTQSADPGASSTTEIREGGTVVWHMNAVTGFSLNNGNGRITVAQNNSGARSTQAWATVQMNGRSGNSQNQTISQLGGVVTHEYELVYTNPYGTSSSSRAPLEVSYSNTLQVKLVDRVYINGVLSSSSETVLPNANVSWSSANTSKATVSAAGVVTGVAAGNVEIVASYTPSGASSPCTATAYLVIVGDGSGLNINDYWTNGGSTVLTP